MIHTLTAKEELFVSQNFTSNRKNKVTFRFKIIALLLF